MAGSYSRREDGDLGARLATVTVVALTRNRRFAAVVGNVLVPAEEVALRDDSVVNVTQVVSVDRAALEERIGGLPDWLLTQVDDGPRRALGLR